MIFLKGVHHFFVENGTKLKFSGLNVNRLEILLRAQRGMTLHNWIIYCFFSDKILILNGAQLGFKTYGKKQEFFR